MKKIGRLLSPLEESYIEDIAIILDKETEGAIKWAIFFFIVALAVFFPCFPALIKFFKNIPPDTEELFPYIWNWSSQHIFIMLLFFGIIAFFWAILSILVKGKMKYPYYKKKIYQVNSLTFNGEDDYFDDPDYRESYHCVTVSFLAGRHKCYLAERWINSLKLGDTISGEAIKMISGPGNYYYIFLNVQKENKQADNHSQKLDLQLEKEDQAIAKISFEELEDFFLFTGEMDKSMHHRTKNNASKV